MDEEIANFVAITGTSDDVARGFIELAGGDYERAVTLFFENPELATSIGAGASTAAPAATSSRRTTGRSNRAGREDASGVIHIDDDDDDDDDEEDDDYMEVDNDFDSDDDAVAATHAANMAQEEEDAAMAKRLQEELYQQGSGSGGGANSDDVRAPIGRTTETLIAPNPSWGEDDDDHSEMQAAFLEQLRRRRNMPRKYSGVASHERDMQPLTWLQNVEVGRSRAEFGLTATRRLRETRIAATTLEGWRSCSGHRLTSWRG